MTKPYTHAGKLNIGPVLTPQEINPTLQDPRKSSRYDKNPENKIPTTDMNSVIRKAVCLLIPYYLK